MEGETLPHIWMYFIGEGERIWVDSEGYRCTIPPSTLPSHAVSKTNSTNSSLKIIQFPWIWELWRDRIPTSMKFSVLPFLSLIICKQTLIVHPTLLSIYIIPYFFLSFPPYNQTKGGIHSPSPSPYLLRHQEIIPILSPLLPLQLPNIVYA